MAALIPPVYGVLTSASFMNGYLIEHEDGGLTLVDTGPSLSFKDALVKRLAQMGRELADIRHIVITHAHYDHVGSLAAIQASVNATTYAHRMDASVIRGEKPNDMPTPESLTPLQRFMTKRLDPSIPYPARVDQLLNDGDDASFICAGAQVVYLPGHSYGQIGLWLSAQRILIGGDVMMHLPWGLIPPMRMVSPDWPAALKSIRKVAELKPEALLLGHGRPILSAASAQVERLAARHGV